MAKKNRNYGRIENGSLIYAPNKLKSVIEDEEGNQIAVQIINATAAQYAVQGWLPIIESPLPEPPEDGYYYTSTYIEQNGSIVQSFVLTPYENEDGGNIE